MYVIQVTNKFASLCEKWSLSDSMTQMLSLLHVILLDLHKEHHPRLVYFSPEMKAEF